MTQSVCVPAAEADAEMKLASFPRLGPQTKEELTSGRFARSPQSRSFPSPSPLRVLAELLIVVQDVARDYKSHNAMRQWDLRLRGAESGYF